MQVNTLPMMSHLFPPTVLEMNTLNLGYNRDREKLPQINLGMYFGETSRLPIYYCVYPGSILDKTHLQYMMQDNEILGIKKVKFVMDKGFYSLSNVRFMVTAQ